VEETKTGTFVKGIKKPQGQPERATNPLVPKYEMPGKDEPPPVDFIRDPYGMEGCSMTAAKWIKMK